MILDGNLKANSSKAAAPNHSMVKLETQKALLTGSLVLALVLAFGAAAHAQSPAPAAEERTSPATQMSPQTSSGNPAAPTPGKVTSKDVDEAFARADVNHDNKLDRREAELFTAVAQRFEQLDNNNDNFVSRDELRKMADS
jgi:hypothetical protein